MNLTSELMRKLEQEVFIHDRVELNCDSFSLIRKVVRMLIPILIDSDKTEIAEQLKINLLKMLSVPERNWEGVFENIPFFENERVISRVIGDYFLELYHEARDEIESSTKFYSVMYREVFKYLSDIKNKKFKIYCHRRERECYESILLELLPAEELDNIFLHNFTDYRNSASFDVLVRVGAIRNYGWSAMPSALVRTPKYRVLKQFIWNGINDDEECFADPVDKIRSIYTFKSAESRFKWKRNITSVNSEISPEIESTLDLIELEDELIVFRVRPSSEATEAICIEFDNEKAILVRPRSQIHIWNSHALDSNSVMQTLKADSLENNIDRGCFFVVNEVTDIDVGGIKVGESPCANIWKSVLSSQPSYTLASRLRQNNLNLIDLESRILGWSQPNDTVIHAPQKREHFLILLRSMKVSLLNQLKIEDHEFSKWCNLAWKEVSASRGKANLHGRVKNEIIDDFLSGILKDNSEHINSKCMRNHMFRYVFFEAGLSGVVSFYPIFSVDCRAATDKKIDQIMLLSAVESMDLNKQN
ncbi:MAG: hypothetical protein ACI88H_001246 [Cocleimonas sp.]|jgi:hypothetical protein